MNPELAAKLIRPTLDTRFHIDYSWWDRAGRDLDVYLRSHMCEEHRASFGELDPGAKVDHIDPHTAEVSRVDGVQHVLISHCSQLPGYLTQQTSLVNAIFRVFLSNGNTPQSPRELGDQLARPAQTILRTLSSGNRVYKGIRPIIESDD